MKTFTINLPDNIEIDSKELTMLLACRFYELGKLSLGQSVNFAGLNKRTFAEMLGKYDVSIFNFSATDLSNDVANA